MLCSFPVFFHRISGESADDLVCLVQEEVELKAQAAQASDLDRIFVPQISFKHAKLAGLVAKPGIMMLANSPVRGNAGQQDFASPAIPGVWMGHAGPDTDNQIGFGDVPVDFHCRSSACLPHKDVFARLCVMN